MNYENFCKKNGIIWFNGELKNYIDAKTHILNHSLHYGSGVFEGIRVYKGKAFKLREHIERLHKSAEILGYNINYSIEDIINIISSLIANHKVSEAYIRPIAWLETESLEIGYSTSKVNLAIAIWEWDTYFSSKNVWEKGIKLIWSDFVRPAANMAPVKAKASCLYGINTISKNLAKKNGADDAIMLDYRGFVAECTAANIFFVKDQTVYTPIADCFLNGITRQTILQIIPELGLKIIETHIKPEEIHNFDEAFVTGTAIEIVPITQIQEKAFNIGNISRKIFEHYKSYTAFLEAI